MDNSNLLFCSQSGEEIEWKQSMHRSPDWVESEELRYCTQQVLSWYGDSIMWFSTSTYIGDCVTFLMKLMPVMQIFSMIRILAGRNICMFGKGRKKGVGSAQKEGGERERGRGREEREREREQKTDALLPVFLWVVHLYVDDLLPVMC